MLAFDLEPTPENLAKLKKLRELRQAEMAGASLDAVSRYLKYSADPCGFVQAIGGFVWSRQREIAESVRDNRRTAVPSCHDVGKSAIAGRIAAWWLSSHLPGEAFVVTTAPTWRQVRNILWREIGRVHRKSQLPGRVNQTEWYIEEEIVAFGVSPADADPAAMQGIHARYVLVILDEACGVAKALWAAADSLVANDDSRMLAIGNPDDPTAEFAEVCKPGSGWNVIHISAFMSPNFTGEVIPDWLKPLLVGKTWVEEKRRSWGEESPLYKTKVLGEFPDQALDGVIIYSTLRAAVLRSLEPLGVSELGVDVARFGTDNSVCYHRAGPVARRKWKVNGNDTTWVAERTIKTQQETNASAIKVDDNGVGGGVTDQLRKAQRDGIVIAGQIMKLSPTVKIVPINFGEGCEQPNDIEQFANVKAKYYWGIRTQLQDGDMDIEEDDDLLAQASCVRYSLNSRGQIAIETKEEIRKRGLPSPDDFEALLLAFVKPNVKSSGWRDLIRSET
jgi:hypothetical protein